MAKTNSDSREPEQVKALFSRVSRVYDAANRAMCAGLDSLWRKRLVGALRKGLPAESSGSASIIDVACGSGDVALETLFNIPGSSVVCADFCAPMLDSAKRKMSLADSKFPGLKISARAKFAEADCLSLPFENDSFDGATLAFGLRNFNDRRACLAEIRRVLKPGAKLHCLEVARVAKIFSPAQSIFMKWVVPAIGTLIGGNWDDYRYLGESTLKYPDNRGVEKLFLEAGFSEISIRPMMLGFVAITSACAKKDQTKITR